MAERLFQVRQKVQEVLHSGRERVEGMREPLVVSSVEEFMRLVNTQENAVVELSSRYRKEGNYYQRERRNDEEMPGFAPPWVTEFQHTGYTFLTDWQARTSSNRRVELRQEHETMGMYEWDDKTLDLQPVDYEGARERWFKETLRLAEAQHQQFPQMRFMVQGVDGLQDYSYYTDEQFAQRRAWVR